MLCTMYSVLRSVLLASSTLHARLQWTYGNNVPLEIIHAFLLHTQRSSTSTFHIFDPLGTQFDDIMPYPKSHVPAANKTAAGKGPVTPSSSFLQFLSVCFGCIDPTSEDGHLRSMRRRVSCRPIVLIWPPIGGVETLSRVDRGASTTYNNVLEDGCKKQF